MPPRKKQIEQPADEHQVDLISRGEDAKKLRDDEYFKNLLVRFFTNVDDEILSLSSKDADRFIECKMQIEGVMRLRNILTRDVEIGTKALAQAQGEATRGRVA